MGQLVSSVLRPSATPPLLKLPTEIILSIASQLSSSPESIVSLSLTCKALFSILERDVVNIQHQSRHNLLILPEKDLGDRYFYCSFFCQLRSISQQ